MDRSLQTKLFNDPVHGFITVPKGILLKLIEHPWVQRLRRIRQLGLGNLVYPAAEHSRFSHALGAMELGQRVLQQLRLRDTTITNREVEGTLIAILLHDVGHGPLSHTLEHLLIDRFDHEMMSLAVMKQLDKEFDGALKTAISIFTDQHPKRFLHQLISSQLDIDRLDYLKRDSFFTGVSEGSVGINRILKTMRVHNGNIVVERKGIYAVENYILSRRFMYMQVYLHKTVLGADSLLRSILRRVKDLTDAGSPPAIPSPPLRYFLTTRPTAEQRLDEETIRNYLELDDVDLHHCLKSWTTADDPVLRDLAGRFVNRRLPRTRFLEGPPTPSQRQERLAEVCAALQGLGLPDDETTAGYYHDFNELRSEAYRYQNEGIWILDDDGTAVEFSKAADARHITALTEPVIRHYAVSIKEAEA